MEKYQIGDRFREVDSPDLIVTIIAISPKEDYQNELSYFVEVRDKGGLGDIWYDVRYTEQMDSGSERITE